MSLYDKLLQAKFDCSKGYGTFASKLSKKAKHIVQFQKLTSTKLSLWLVKVTQANFVRCVNIIREKEVLKVEGTCSSLHVEDLDMVFEKIDYIEILKELETWKNNPE